MGFLGINGLKALAFQMGLVFLVYGQKKVALSAADIKATEKFQLRLNLKKAESPEARKALISNYRKTMWAAMATDTERYGELAKDVAAQKIYQERTYVR